MSPIQIVLQIVEAIISYFIAHPPKTSADPEVLSLHTSDLEKLEKIRDILKS